MKLKFHLKQFTTLNLNINKASFNLKVIYESRQKSPKRITRIFRAIDVNQPEVKVKTMVEVFSEKYIL